MRAWTRRGGWPEMEEGGRIESDLLVISGFMDSSFCIVKVPLLFLVCFCREIEPTVWF